MTPSRTTAALAAVTTLVVLLAGCTGDDDPAPAATAPTAREAAAPSLAVGRTGGPACLDEGAAVRRVGVSDPTVVATGDLTIVSAEALGTGVSLFGSQGVVLTDPPDDPVSFSGTDWPIDLGPPVTARGFDASSRTDLVGMRVADGQQVQPLLGLEVADGISNAALTGVRLTWTSAEREETGSLDVPFAYSFPEGTCSASTPSASPVG